MSDQPTPSDISLLDEDDSIRVYVVSLGCPKNRVDTERLLAGLPGKAVLVDSPDVADMALINTCGFIGPAVEESVRTILETADACAESSTPPVLAVAGCLVSRYGEELAEQMPEVDAWISTDELDTWPELAAKALGIDPRTDMPDRIHTTAPSYAYIKIGEGCRHACRFCAIPSIRGVLRSDPDDAILREAARLTKLNISEFILVAQDLTAHGLDRGDPNGLLKLLEKLLNQGGMDRLRMLYLYPKGIGNDLLDFIRESGPTLLPYFDIPLQHAHQEILKAMGRPFTGDPRHVINRVRSRMPNAAIRTTFIVGYPGETDTHFQTLCDFVREARLDHVGVFPYYPEDGTVAATMDNQIPEDVKEERRRHLMEIQEEISREKLTDWQDKTVDVLVDGPHPEWPGLYIGRTWFQAPDIDGVTYISGPGVEPGKTVSAQIIETKSFDLVALA